MWLHVLGAAAGGGLPQWNCACTNCVAARSCSPLVTPRSQSQLAVSGDGCSWYLVNASPDLRDQLLRNPKLHPHSEQGLRNTPISGVVLTSADLDHTLGLLLMREFTPVSIYSTAGVRAVLSTNPFFSMLDRVPGQSQWGVLPTGTPIVLDGNLKVTMVRLPGKPPAYVSDEWRKQLDSEDMTVGLILEATNGRRAAYFPALPALSKETLSLFETCQVVLADGTFWSESELQSLQAGTPSATEMGHIPIGGDTGSLRALSNLSHARSIYTHINNTNPVLDESSPQHRVVLEAGCEIAFDGMEINL
ncbi:pyrroloquinoline quinone biosynthesis protein PqqB [Edaphobacter aggregans]|uniref:pyrroloquinoline quinone biosynthesis protein PqqB n=1 Tax=Edaphobacter aggregans TaxID=570835 RepID=UPI00054E4D98|nr:pyrroloquinoline quinone biosynthesis protein PqqB [Edaphobacter aggregans]